MENSKPAYTPVEEKLKLTRENDGKRVDLTSYERLDIVYGVGLLSRFMEEQCVSHFQGAKGIVRYIKGTLIKGIFYASNNDVELVGYTIVIWLKI